MRKEILLAVLALTISATMAAQPKELTKVNFTPQWTPQAQFSGFYMAKEKGFFEEEGLDVSIDHIGINSTESITERLTSGKSQFVMQQFLQSVISRSNGVKLVNVLQITQHTGLMCIGQKPIDDVKDLDGLKVGRWRQGYSEICDMITQWQNIDIQWVPFVNGINLFLFGAVDATLCYSYSEFNRFLMALGEVPEENILRFPDMGIDGPEDGLYVLESYYDKNRETVEKFIRATKKGWEYVRGHQEEAVDLSLKICAENNVATNRIYEKMMLEEYLRLQEGAVPGEASFDKMKHETFDVLVNALESSGMIVNKPAYEEIVR